jgi:serine/threonine-protein kinase
VIDTILGGSYRVVRKIGAGGMADVYEVEHLRLGSRFAAKVARTITRDEATRRRFFREARMLASIKSDHVVAVFDVSGPEVDPPFMLMELLNGQDLRQLLRDTLKLPVSRATKLVSDACLGLVAVHAMGVIHRDLKPENLFVTHRDSGEECCKLLDFGVVKAEQGTSTQQGGLVGTLKYMAPEQIEQAGLVTAQSDVRSMAAILYECLTGKPPFEAQTVEQLLFRILNERPEPLHTLGADVPAELEALVMRALERDPLRRPPTARAFADALRPFTFAPARDFDVTQRDLAAPLRTPVPSARGDARRRILLGLAIPAFVGAVATAIGLRASDHSPMRSAAAAKQSAPDSARMDLAASTFPTATGGTGFDIAADTQPSTASSLPRSTATSGATVPTASAPPAESNAAGSGEGKLRHATEQTTAKSRASPTHPGTGVTTVAGASSARATGSFLRIDPASPYEH